MSIIRSPNSPAAPPVPTTITQSFGVSAASPSPVALGCSVAPRPDGSRWLISGGGTRTRPGYFSWRGGFVTAPRFPPKRVRRAWARCSGPRALPAGVQGTRRLLSADTFVTEVYRAATWRPKERGGEHCMIVVEKDAHSVVIDHDHGRARLRDRCHDCAAAGDLRFGASGAYGGDHAERRHGGHRGCREHADQAGRNDPEQAAAAGDGQRGNHPERQHAAEADGQRVVVAGGQVRDDDLRQVAELGHDDDSEAGGCHRPESPPAGAFPGL